MGKLKNNVKEIIKIVLVVVGTLVGAGFASGKEIFSFFFAFGKIGMIGIIISSIIICFVIYKVFYISINNNINSYKDFCDLISKKINYKCGLILNNIVNIFLLITYFIMISGFSSFLKQEFNINGLLGSSIIVILCYFIFLKNVNGLINISNYLIPILIFLIFFVSLKNKNFLYNYNSVFNSGNIDIFSKCDGFIIIKAIIKAILYSCYNCIILIPVLIAVKNKIENKRNIGLISYSSFFVIICLCFSVFNLLLQGDMYIFNLEMPVIAVVKKYGIFYKYIYLFIIGVSIFTTTLSSGCGFLNNCCKNEKEFKITLVIMSITAVFLSQISFSLMVNLLYPILGLVGFIEVVLLII